MLPHSTAILLPASVLTSLCAGLSPPHGHLLALLGLRHSVLGSPHAWVPSSPHLCSDSLHQPAPFLQTPSLPSSDSDTHVGQPSCVVSLLFDLSSGTLLWGTGVLLVRGRCLLDSAPLQGFRTELSRKGRGVGQGGKGRVSSFLNSKM